MHDDNMEGTNVENSSSHEDQSRLRLLHLHIHAQAADSKLGIFTQ